MSKGVRRTLGWFVTWASQLTIRERLVERLFQDLDHARASVSRLERFYETRFLELRQSFVERLRDKDGIIADLRLRLAVLETDAMREKQQLAASAEARRKPVPQFDGPLPYQDELTKMAAEMEVPEAEKPNEKEKS